MNESMRDRQSHLRLILGYTLLEFLLVVQGVLHKWDPTAIFLLAIGLGASWLIYSLNLMDYDLAMWITFILIQVGIFTYGVHQTSLFNLAPLAGAAIFLVTGTWITKFIRITVGVYFLTLVYTLLFVVRGTLELDEDTIGTLVMHCIIVGLIGFWAEILQREYQRVKAGLEDNISELAESNHQMENFLANVSHELRTPIGTITGLSAVMLDQQPELGMRNNILEIQRAGYRLFDRIEDILDYTEIDTKRLYITEEVYAVASLVNDVSARQYMGKSAEAPEVKFKVDPTIPPRIVGDPKKIKKVMNHLIDNAVKFSPGGTVMVEIYQIPKEYGLNLSIKVTDNGQGIKKESLRRLSRGFYQQNGERNRQVGGLGLGLSVVYGIVGAMHGFVQIKSQEGAGTVVSVSIPHKIMSGGIFFENPDDMQTYYNRLNNYELRENIDTRHISCPGIKALVVDDEPMNLVVAEGILSGYGMQLRTVNSGIKAVELCAKEHFDIIFLDHMMPEMDGVETLKLIRQNHNPSLPDEIIIAFTANAVSSAKKMLIGAGFDEFLSKPVEISELDRVLRKVLPKTAIKERTDIVERYNAEKAAAPQPKASHPEELINRKTGLMYCQNDEGFYRTIMQCFATESVKKREAMGEALAAQDWPNYRIQVHSLKSTAKNIGAESLSELAKASEDAAAAGDGSYVKEHHKEVMEAYTCVVSHIVEELGLEIAVPSCPCEEEPAAAEAAADATLSEIAEQELLKALAELAASLDTFEADKAESQLADLAELAYQGKPLSALLKPVSDDVDSFDLSAAAEKLVVIVADLKGGEA